MEKSDLKEIKKIVTDVVDTRIAKSEAYLEDRIEYSIAQSEDRLEKKIGGLGDRIDGLDAKIDDVEKRLSKKIEDEVDSLVEINRAAIARLDRHSDKLDNHEVRIKKLEVKAAK